MTERDPDQDIIDEIERQRSEGTNLDGLTPVKAAPGRNPRAVVSIRVTPDAFDLVARAAKSRGVSVSEFFRDAAIAAADLELASADAGTMGLADIANELDRLRDKVGAAMRSNPSV